MLPSLQASARPQGPVGPLVRVAVLAGLVVCCLALAARGERTDWYVVRLDGSPAGWMAVTTTEGGELITTSTEMRVAVRRGEAIVQTAFRSEVVERAGGRVVSMTRVLEEVGGERRTTWRFPQQPGQPVTIETDARGREREATAPVPEGPFVGPAGERAYLRLRLAAGAQTIAVRVVDPLSGLDPLPVERRVVGTDTLDAPAGAGEAERIGVTRTLTRRGDERRTIHEWLDDTGRLVRAKTAVGAIEQVVELTDERTARRAADNPPDLIDSTRVPASERIRGLRRPRRAAFVLRAPGLGVSALEGAPQRVERLDADAVRVHVNLSDRGPRVAIDDARREALLEPTPLLECADPRIVVLAEHALERAPAGADDRRRAEALRRFVHGYIEEKSLDVAFASAAAVARSREGDCTEHATLLAAMLRAAGIPCELVAGLAYEDGPAPSFVYHVWVRALVRDGDGWRWMDLDATRPGEARGAAQIALTAADGRDQDGLWGEIAATLGTLEVDVERAR